MAAILSIMVLGALAMLLGALALWRRGAPRKQVWLMVLAAIVLGANVAIWAIPVGNGPPPASASPDH